MGGTGWNNRLPNSGARGAIRALSTVKGMSLRSTTEPALVAAWTSWTHSGCRRVVIGPKGSLSWSAAGRSPGWTPEQQG